LKQRASDLDRREAQLVRAAEQQKITNQECRDVERRKSEMDYAERVREVESGHKVLEDRAVEWQALRQQHEEQKTHLQECSLEAEGLRSELLAEKHKLGLAQKDLAMSQNEVEKLTTELRHLDSLLKAARADLEEALKDLEHQRGIVKRLNAEAERVAAERQLASETAESRLQLERESRTREREAYLQELGVAKEEARTNISLEQKRWAQDRDMYEKRERETHRAYLGIKEAAETEVSAHETTKARLEDIELQLHQSRQECQNLRTMYHDAKNSFATSDWRPDIKAEWPSNPAVYPQTSFPGSALVKHAKVGIFTAPQTAVSHSAVTLAKDSFAEEMDARRKREAVLQQEEDLVKQMQAARKLRLTSLEHEGSPADSGISYPLMGGATIGLSDVTNHKSVVQDFSQKEKIAAELEARDQAEQQILATSARERKKLEDQERLWKIQGEERERKMQAEFEQKLRQQRAQMQVQANEEIVKMHQYANAEDIHSQDGEQVHRREVQALTSIRYSQNDVETGARLYGNFDTLPVEAQGEEVVQTTQVEQVGTIESMLEQQKKRAEDQRNIQARKQEEKQRQNEQAAREKALIDAEAARQAEEARQANMRYADEQRTQRRRHLVQIFSAFGTDDVPDLGIASMEQLAKIPGSSSHSDEWTEAKNLQLIREQVQLDESGRVSQGKFLTYFMDFWYAGMGAMKDADFNANITRFKEELKNMQRHAYAEKECRQQENARKQEQDRAAKLAAEQEAEEQRNLACRQKALADAEAARKAESDEARVAEAKKAEAREAVRRFNEEKADREKKEKEEQKIGSSEPQMAEKEIEMLPDSPISMGTQSTGSALSFDDEF